VTRLNVMLVLAIIASGLFLVRTAHESRRLYAELDRARSQQRQLDLDLKQLEAERHAQATNLRVEKVARERLAMRPATPAVTRYVADPGAEAAK
jgi:cell division protein FtsL